jgi:uncharacterized protein YjbI with pentapeptide repeats
MVAENGQEGNAMAYQKPVDMLASGNTLWNIWRQASADVQAFEPDLHGADLSHADLRGADLSGADLHKALLDQARFDEAKVF